MKRKPKFTVQKQGLGRIKALIWRDGGRVYFSGSLEVDHPPSLAALRAAGRDPHVQRAVARSFDATLETLSVRHPTCSDDDVAEFLYETIAEYLVEVAPARKPKPTLTVAELAEAHRQERGDSTYHRALIALGDAIDAGEIIGSDVTALVRRASIGGFTVGDRTAKPWAHDAVRKLLGTLAEVYKWAAANALVEPDAEQRVGYAVSLPLPDYVPKPQGKDAVPDSVVDATLKHIEDAEVRDLIELQRLTGARPGELCALTRDAIEDHGGVWVYTPEKHKTARLGKRRSIFFGPKSQEIITPRLNGRAKVFSLTPAAYRQRVHTACDRAGVDRWGPNQIRHTVSNRIKSKYGREAEAVYLGHSMEIADEHYLETELPLGLRIAKEEG